MAILSHPATLLGEFRAMSKTPANQNGAQPPRIVALTFAVIALILSGLIAANAQQTPQVTQQRPRRVGGGEGQTSKSAPQTSSPSDGEEVGDGDVVRVDTQLVSVPAVVTDRAGHLPPNLRAENFVLYEDGHPQQISNFATTEAPFEIVLLLDTSGSTRADIALIRQAANAFLDALRPGDRVSIVAFKNTDDGPSGLATVDVISRLTDDREALRRALENVSESNGTPYYDALTRIAEDIFSEPPREELRGRRAIVALTDGVDSASESDFSYVRAKLQRSGVACYFIQVNT